MSFFVTYSHMDLTFMCIMNLDLEFCEIVVTHMDPLGFLENIKLSFFLHRISVGCVSVPAFDNKIKIILPLHFFFTRLYML